MNIQKVPKSELDSRLQRLCAAMDLFYPDWELCAFTGGVNLFYLTGTICDGVFMIKREGESVLWVRRSYDRALLESELPNIRPMPSFRAIAAAYPKLPDTLYLDKSFATLEWYALLSKHLHFENVLPNDNIMLRVRAIKSEYELNRMRKAGGTIKRCLLEKLPALLFDGITETDLCAKLFAMFVENGHHGLSRFSMRNADVVLGHIGFGDSPLYPSVFNGASGLAGLSPASPVLGSRDRVLKPGDLIYSDIGFGSDGYNADCTVIYSYKTPPSDCVMQAHAHCLELEFMARDMLRPGAVPQDIYEAVVEAVCPEYKDSFMGAKNRTVPFLGHSVGLFIDEWPVIASGFTEPLAAGMTIALEPKIGLEGIGMVGSENTYLITDNGAETLTGDPMSIIIV